MQAPFVTEESPEGHWLVVTGPWSMAASEALAAGSVDGLVLNYARGFQETNLEFLADWPILRLSIVHRGLTDLGPLDRLAETLEYLSVQAAPNAQVELGALPRLTGLAAGWHAVEETIHELDAPDELTLMDYDERTLAPLAVHPTLMSVKLKHAPALESLDGAQDLRALNTLFVGAARELADISATRSLADTLSEIELESCLDVSSLDDLEGLRGLRFVGVNACGEIDSLRPLGRLQNLVHLHMWGSTRIRDNDLSPLLLLRNLQELRIRSRTSYQPPLMDVRTQLGLEA